LVKSILNHYKGAVDKINFNSIQKSYMPAFESMQGISQLLSATTAATANKNNKSCPNCQSKSKLHFALELGFRFHFHFVHFCLAYRKKNATRSNSNKIKSLGIFPVD